MSGGADSVCLLLLLSELGRDIGLSLTAVHVEHGIRGEESRRDAAFVEDLCRNLGVGLELFHVDVPRYRDEDGLSTEEAARELRFDCFLQACEAHGADRIALAHHANDCAETMLFHLSRGTGIRGMCGIRPVSKRGDITVIRPLLGLTRAEIEDWLTARGQTYCTDSTNADVAYARNRIRERVVPELEQINAQAVPHMQRLSGQLVEICDYLDETAWEAGRDVFSLENDGDEPGDGLTGNPVVLIRIAPFLEMHPVLQRHLLLLLIGLVTGGRKDITSVHVEQVLHLMTADVGAQTSLPGRVRAERNYETVVLNGEETNEQPSEEKELMIPGETVLENGLHFSTEIFEFTDFSQKIPKKPYTKWFDYDKIDFAVCLRNRRPGDYLQTDADGGHKKLKKFFIDEKVPSSERDRVCLLADGDHIMWAVGYRISEAYKVTSDTKRILCVTVCGQDT